MLLFSKFPEKSMKTIWYECIYWLCSNIETKEAARIGKRNPLYPIRATSFVSKVMYLKLNLHKNDAIIDKIKNKSCEQLCL
jgi:hypothetical protein